MQALIGKHCQMTNVLHEIDYVALSGLGRILGDSQGVALGFTIGAPLGLAPTHQRGGPSQTRDTKTEEPRSGTADGLACQPSASTFQRFNASTFSARQQAAATPPRNGNSRSAWLAPTAHYFSDIVRGLTGSVQHPDPPSNPPHKRVFFRNTNPR